MSNPAGKTTATKTEGNNPTYEQRVNEVVSKMAEKEDGTWELPEDTPEDIKFSATLEKRRRDTQSGYTTAKQDVKALEVERDALAEKLSELASKSFKLSEDQREELEDLKVVDPEAWRQKLNTYEEAARQSTTEMLAETKVASSQASETERRRLILEDFTRENGDIITDTVLANDVPPRFTKALVDGTTTFEEFLVDVKAYLETPKVVSSGEEVAKQPNLNKAAGGSAVQKSAVDKDAVASYDKVTF